MFNTPTLRFARRALAGAAFLVANALTLSTAQAAVGLSWANPANNSSFTVGTLLNPNGSASASGVVGGSGLDLALVLDSSGSMTSTFSGKTLQTWQREAATALVNALPQASTSVAVVEFDSDANLVRQLTGLTSNKNLVLNAINGIDASGGTDIGLGIRAATAELTSARATPSRNQMQVVISDGFSSGNAPAAAAAARLAGIDSVHTIGLPGHDITQMSNIAISGNGIYTNASTNLASLIGLFNGTAGNLVGIDSVDVTLNDGTFIDNIALDGLGNFVLPTITIGLGNNVFTATAFDTAGNSITQQLVLIGTPAVPEPASWAAALAGLAVCGAVVRRRVANAA